MLSVRAMVNSGLDACVVTARGLVWSGLVWSGLVWSGQSRKRLVCYLPGHSSPLWSGQVVAAMSDRVCAAGQSVALGLIN